MKVAGKISEELGRPLSREKRKKAGPWVHYAFGTSVGAVFGLASELEPDSVRAINPLFAGAAYGVAVFLAAHEVCRTRAETVFESPQGTHSGTNRRIHVAFNLWHRHGA